MKPLLVNIVALVLTLGAGTTLAAGDAAAGKTKSATCTSCHGADGISPSDLWPNLKSQKTGYLVKQIKAFRDGGRKDPMMSAMVSRLSDQDIEDLAAYYSAL